MILTTRGKVRVLIVDDSMLFREALARGLSADPGIQVIATAVDPFMARDKIIEHEPDVMILDIELPRMNGIEFLQRLMPQYPIPVVVISANEANIFEAFKAGAVDFVSKPEGQNNRGMEALLNELIIKVKIASTAKVGHWKKANENRRIRGTAIKDIENKIIAIGASTGGTEALLRVLKTLPQEIPGIVIVQHMPPNFTKLYAERLNNLCLLEVKEAKNGDTLCPGRVLLAPGDFQMKLKKTGDTYRVECFQGERVNGHCPSVDVLFESVADKAGENAFGIILTGMGADGANGLLKMRKCGARTIGQDEASCTVYGMPKVAYNIGAVEKQVPLDEISDVLYQYLTT
jgi:two-component system chemotaxis response regulator CheB